MAFDIYEAVTGRIIQQIEAGTIPWERPWTGLQDGAFSRSTGKPYSFINQLMLVKPGEYLTLKQCNEAGGKIKKGAKSNMVVFWKVYAKEKTDDNGEKKTDTFPILRYYRVFHIEDCEGIEPKRDKTEPRIFNPVEEAERIAADYFTRTGCKLVHVAGNSASYNFNLDRVKMPLKEQFVSEAEYYSTLFHEMTHSTGHKKRLDRLENASFGSEVYSREELVAEIGAAAFMNHLGIETDKSFRNSAAYIENWLTALKNDKKLIVTAASKAEKAFALILNEEAAATEQLAS